MEKFFKKLTEHMEGYELHIFVKRKADIISVIVSPVVEGKDKDYLPSFNISGTVDELDESFFNNITTATSKTKEVVSDINSFVEEMNKKKEEEKGKNTPKEKTPSKSAVAKAKEKAKLKKKKEPTPAEKMQKFIDQGKNYFGRKRFKQAIASYDEALKFATGKDKKMITDLQMEAKVKKMAAEELGDYKESEDVADQFPAAETEATEEAADSEEEEEESEDESNEEEQEQEPAEVSDPEENNETE